MHFKGYHDFSYPQNVLFDIQTQLVHVDSGDGWNELMASHGKYLLIHICLISKNYNYSA